MIQFSCTNCGKKFTVDDALAGRHASCKTCGAAVIVPAVQAEQNNRIVISFNAATDMKCASAVMPVDRNPMPPPLPRTHSPGPPPFSSDHLWHLPPLPSAAPVETLADICIPVAPIGDPPKDAFGCRPPGRAQTSAAIAAIAGRRGADTAGFRQLPPIRVLSIRGNPADYYQIEYHIRGLSRGQDGTPVYREQHVAEIQLTCDYPRQSPKCRMLSPIFIPTSSRLRFVWVTIGRPARNLSNWSCESRK